MKKIVSAIIVIVLLSLMVWKLVGNKKEIDSRKEVKTVTSSIAVTVGEAKRMLVSNELRFVGVTEANQEVVISPEATGKVVEINFKEGDYVNKGKVLARLDDRQAQLSLNNAKLVHKKYKDDYEKFLLLRKSDAVSENQLLEMKLAYENAEIQMDQATKMLEDTRVTAPFSGYITQKSIDLGAFVASVPATPIAKLIDIAKLKIVCSVSETDAYTLKLGQDVSVVAGVYPDVVFKGKISYISSQGDEAHTYPVEVSVENQTKYPLKAGTYVNMTIQGAEQQTRLMIPRNAIVSSVKEATVYLVKGQEVKLTPITAGKDHGNYLEVVAGLQEGDQVVTNGQINLMDGATVVVRSE